MRYIHAFFISNAFLNSALINFFMNLNTNVAQVLLKTYNNHNTETRFVFSIYVSISTPKCIYVKSKGSFFHFQPPNNFQKAKV